MKTESLQVPRLANEVGTELQRGEMMKEYMKVISHALSSEELAQPTRCPWFNLIFSVWAR